MAKIIDKIIQSNIAPSDKNVMWVDTSGDKPVVKTYTGGTWKGDTVVFPEVVMNIYRRSSGMITGKLSWESYYKLMNSKVVPRIKLYDRDDAGGDSCYEGFVSNLYYAHSDGVLMFDFAHYRIQCSELEGSPEDGPNLVISSLS